MFIFGQQKLLNKINSYTLMTLPKTILFLGEYGCGKHLMASYIAEKFDLELVKIDSDTTAEQLTEYRQSPIEKLYLIDLDNISQKSQSQENRLKAQNPFLKFIEEPSPTTYIIVTTSSTANALNTVLNRCIKFTFEPYSPELLKEKCDWQVANSNDLVYKVCTTPGQLSGIDGNNISALHDLCNKIITGIFKANYANTLKIYTKINFAENYDKFDFDLFFKMLKYVAFEDFKANKTETSLNIYNYTNQASIRLLDKRLNRETFMINFLDGLWRLTH